MDTDLVKQLKHLVKHFDNFSLHAYRDPKAESWSNAGFVDFRGYQEVKGIKTEGMIRLACDIHNGSTSDLEQYEYNGRRYNKYPNAYIPKCGYWGALYRENLIHIVKAIPNDFIPKFVIRLDAGTSDLLINAKLHDDRLYLTAKNPEDPAKEIKFLVDNRVCAHNSARFGSPTYDGDTTGSNN